MITIHHNLTDSELLNPTEQSEDHLVRELTQRIDRLVKECEEDLADCRADLAELDRQLQEALE